MPSSDRPVREAHAVRFRGLIFTVERDIVRLSNGRRATYDIVRHGGSVVLIPQPERETVVLIRQYRWAVGRWIWELPAGGLEPGESPARAARRECAEEIGLRPDRVERLGTFYPTPGFCDERMMFYRCTGLRRPARPVAGDDDEQIEPRTFRLADVRRLIRRGEIIDLKTVAGLELVAAPVSWRRRSS
ncbi:MAG TPA: NUDIX hydrolase [Vicinamibacterales bacterium]|nr:NUDIX hydrolase [Vicinamibacterales bacterium]